MSRYAEARAGEEKAADRWDRQIRAWRRCLELARRRPLSAWESAHAARRYWEDAWAFQRERIELLVSELRPQPGKKILDIGSGPGVLAVPLAGQGAEVTAVDPALGMISFLKERIAASAASGVILRIECLAKSWEEVDAARDLAPPYDAAVASLSLLMNGIDGCLAKMRSVCRGEILLLWTSSHGVWERHLRRLYPLLYGLDYVPRPGVELLVEVLKELGWRHEVRRLGFVYRESFGSRAEALEHFKRYFAVERPEQVAALQGFPFENLKPGDGGLTLSHPYQAELIKVFP
jgi:SAM-dependent methyltransferase